MTISSASSPARRTGSVGVGARGQDGIVRERRAAAVLAAVGRALAVELARAAQQRAGHALAHRVRDVEEVVVVVDRRDLIAALVEEGAPDRLGMGLEGR